MHGCCDPDAAHRNDILETKTVLPQFLKFSGTVINVRNR